MSHFSIDLTKLVHYHAQKSEILDYCVDFLQNAHIHDEYTVREGINILRFYMKSRALNGKDKDKLNENEFKKAIAHILEEHAINYCHNEYEKFLKRQQEKFIKDDFLIFKKLDE